MKRINLLMSIGLFLIICLTSCSQKPQSITIGAPVGPADGPLYIANEKGYLKSEGINTTIIPFTSGRLALDALLAGRVQIAMVAETPLALAAFQGHEFIVIATMTESPHKMVVRNEINFKTPQDLKGKTLGVLMGSAGEFWLYSYLLANRIETSEVKIVNLQPADMISAIINGDIDCFFSWEPYPYLAKKELGDKVTVISSEGIYMQTFNVVVMKEFAQNNPEILEKLLKALLDSVVYMHKNKEESIKIVAKNSGMEQKVLEGIWEDHKYNVFLNQSLVDYLTKQGEWAKNTGIVSSEKKVPDYKDYVNVEFLRILKTDK